MSLQRIRPWMILTLLSALVCLFAIITNGSPLALVTIGTQFSEGIPRESGGTEGYDGQFVYYIARDPSSAAQYIDVPAYRFQRILLPALAMLLSLGQTALIPWVLLFINLAAIAIGTALVEYLLQKHGGSRWYALTYGLTFGIFGAVRLSLPEPLAYALVLGGIVLARRESWFWSALLFALAALARETTLLFPTGYGLFLLLNKRWRLAIVFGFAVLTPFILWQIVLYTHLGTFGVGSGGAQATSFEIIPFAGLLRLITDTPPESHLRILLVIVLPFLLPFVLLPTFWALRRGLKDLFRRQLSLYTIILLANSLIMLFVPFSTYREPHGILRFIVGLQIALLLYAAQERNTRVLRYSTFWAVTALLVFSLY